MKNILCYGDSNTYGLSPDWMDGAGGRHDISVRWTGVLQKLLGPEYRIIEEGLNGRTTCFDDPTTPGRNGLEFLSICVESHMPLDLVIIMLGTNDTKRLFGANAFEISLGIGRLAKAVLNPYAYLYYTPPKVLIAAPVPLGEASVTLFDGITDADAVVTSRLLAGFYKTTAESLGCEFIDLAPVASASPKDGVHLSGEAHASIAKAYAEKIRAILG